MDLHIYVNVSFPHQVKLECKKRIGQTRTGARSERENPGDVTIALVKHLSMSA